MTLYWIPLSNHWELSKQDKIEEISKLFLWVSIASIMMKFAQKMHKGIIELSIEVEFWVFCFLLKYSLLTQKNTKNIPKSHEKWQKTVKNQKFKIPLP